MGWVFHIELYQWIKGFSHWRDNTTHDLVHKLLVTRKEKEQNLQKKSKIKINFLPEPDFPALKNSVATLHVMGLPYVSGEKK